MATTHVWSCPCNFTRLMLDKATAANDGPKIEKWQSILNDHIADGCLLHDYPKEKKTYVISPSYIVTFTTDPRKKYHRDLELFQQEVECQLKRKNIAEAMYSIEHIKSNMHAHCYIKCLGRAMNNPLTDWKFMHNKVGLVHVRPAGVNNGIEAYMEKENPIFERHGEWPVFSFQQVE